jgi:hypothetical protein
VRVERGQRLVQQQHAGVAGERACERDALALAAGDVPGPLAGEMRDSEAVEQVVHAPGAAERHVAAHRHVREKRVLLEDEPDRARLGGAVDTAARVEPDVAAKRDPAAVGRAQTGDRAQDRALARPGRADQRDGLGADAQADVELVRAKADGDVEVERLHDESSL